MASCDVWTFGRYCWSILARAAAPAIWAPLVGGFLDAAWAVDCDTSGLELLESPEIAYTCLGSSIVATNNITEAAWV